LGVLQWTVWGVFMAVVMGRLRKSRLRRREQIETGVLRGSPGTLMPILEGTAGGNRPSLWG
jgi:hypothetical protein